MLWNKYGSEIFNFIIIENCNIEDLNKRESYYVSILNKDLIYNLAAVKDAIPMSELKKEKREKQIDKKHSKESLENLSRVQKERYKKTPMSEETKRKLSEAKKGKKCLKNLKKSKE